MQQTSQSHSGWASRSQHGNHNTSVGFISAGNNGVFCENTKAAEASLQKLYWNTDVSKTSLHDDSSSLLRWFLLLQTEVCLLRWMLMLLWRRSRSNMASSWRNTAPCLLHWLFQQVFLTGDTVTQLVVILTGNMSAVIVRFLLKHRSCCWEEVYRVFFRNTTTLHESSSEGNPVKTNNPSTNTQQSVNPRINSKQKRKTLFHHFWLLFKM